MKGKRKQKAKRKLRVHHCKTWGDVLGILERCREDVGLLEGEEAWFRGSLDHRHPLEPSLIWRARDEGRLADLDAIEQDLFFEFQARARELHERGLSDWDYLFFMRHHGVPTRILDWTESFGVAVYFASLPQQTSEGDDDRTPCVWVLNPWALGEKGGHGRDAVSPWALFKGWDYGDLARTAGPWPWEAPLPLYPLQVAERMRAQSGWFTIHGEDPSPLEVQCPKLLARIDFSPHAIGEAREFLTLAGLTGYRLFPDLDHLAEEVSRRNGLRGRLAGRPDLAASPVKEPGTARGAGSAHPAPSRYPAASPRRPSPGSRR